MFSQFAKKVTKKASKSTKSIPQTAAFVKAVSEQDIRLSYGALSTVALSLGEVPASGQSLGQRGIGLVKALPADLQPMVCRGGNVESERHGTYHRKAVESWTVEPREDLLSLAVLGTDVVEDALATWLESLGQDSSEE